MKTDRFYGVASCQVFWERLTMSEYVLKAYTRKAEENKKRKGGEKQVSRWI